MDEAQITPQTDERPSDADLIRGSMAGDQCAWSELVGRYQRLVYSIPRRYGLGHDLSDDVFQGVFAALVKHLGSVRDAGGLPKWLITTAHRESWRVSSAARQSLRTSVGTPPSPPEEPPPHAEMLRWERQNEVHRALAELGGRCEPLLRAIFLDRDRPSYAEIARRQGLPIGSIGPMRARCLAKLAELLRGL